MNDKEMMLSLAARADQLYLEFEAMAKTMVGLFAGHETMVAAGLLRSASRILMKTAAKME